MNLNGCAHAAGALKILKWRAFLMAAANLFIRANLQLRSSPTTSSSSLTLDAALARERSGEMPVALHRELCRATNRVVLPSPGAPQAYPGGAPAAKGFVEVAVREPATALWWLISSALVRTKMMSVHVEMIEPLPALCRWRAAPGDVPLLVAIVEAAARDAALPSPRLLLQRDGGSAVSSAQTNGERGGSAALSDAVVQLAALLLRPVRSAWLAAALQMPPPSPIQLHCAEKDNEKEKEKEKGGSDYSTRGMSPLLPRRLLSPRALAERCVLPMLRDALNALEATTTTAVDDSSIAPNLNIAAAHAERGLALALALGDAALRSGGTIPIGVLHDWLAALLPLALLHAAFRQARLEAYCEESSIAAPAPSSAPLSSLELKRKLPVLRIGRMRMSTLSLLGTHLARLARAVADAHGGGSEPAMIAPLPLPPLPRLIVALLREADWRVRTLCRVLDRCCETPLRRRVQEGPSPLPPSSARHACALSLARCVRGGGAQGEGALVLSVNPTVRAAATAASLFGVGRDEIDRVLRMMWEDGSAVEPMRPDHVLSLPEGWYPEGIGDATGAAASSLASRARRGCVLCATLVDALALALATLHLQESENEEEKDSATQCAFFFPASHEIGPFVGGMGRFFVHVAEEGAAMSSDGAQHDAPPLWLRSLRAALLARLLRTARTSQQQLAQSVHGGSWAGATQRRAAVVEAELRLSTLVLELERRAAALTM